MSTDDALAEIEAMKEVAQALAKLDEDAVARVLRWAGDRYNVKVLDARGDLGEEGDGGGSSTGELESLAELYAAADPQSNPDRALVAAYWLQEHEGHSEIASRAINDELKHLGHGIGNITDAMDALKDRRPQLVVQTRKAGQTRQAQKKFKITHEGKNAVKAMISSQPGA